MGNPIIQPFPTGGPNYPSSPLFGTVAVTNGSPTITFSFAQTLIAGTPLVFASQPATTYFLAAPVTAGTTATLTANYSGTTAGATTVTFGWSGTPIVVEPGYIFFTPGQPPSAQEMNALFQNRTNEAAYNYKLARSLNWQQSFLPKMGGAGASIAQPYQTLACVGYDTLTQKWIVGGASSIAGNSDAVLSTGYGDQTGWITYAATPGSQETATGSTRSIVRGNEPSVSSKYIYAAFVLDASNLVSLSRIDTTVPTTTHQTSPAGTATDALDCQLATVPGVIIAGVGASSAAHSNVYSSTDHGVTWVAQTALTISAAISGWLVSTNPAAQVLAIPFAFAPNYISSPDGTTWTAQTGLTSVMGGSEVPTTLTWADDGTGAGCWLFTSFDTALHMYRSTDGVSWTSFAHDVPSGLDVTSMAYISDARILVGLIAETPLARVIYSLNGGAHWSSCRVEAPIVSSVSGIPTSHKLVAGPNQAAIACGGTLLLSSAIGDPGGVGSA